MKRIDSFKTLFGGLISLPFTTKIVSNLPESSYSMPGKVISLESEEIIEELQSGEQIIYKNLSKIGPNDYSALSRLPKETFSRIGLGLVKQISHIQKWSDGYIGNSIIWRIK